jgi:hypothetical protein
MHCITQRGLEHLPSRTCAMKFPWLTAATCSYVSLCHLDLCTWQLLCNAVHWHFIQHANIILDNAYHNQRQFHCRMFWLVTTRFWNGTSRCSRPSLHVPVMQYIWCCLGGWDYFLLTVCADLARPRLLRAQPASFMMSIQHTWLCNNLGTLDIAAVGWPWWGCGLYGIVAYTRWPKIKHKLKARCQSYQLQLPH